MNETSDSDARLQKLLEKRGQDLVRGLIEEFRMLNREVAALKRELAATSDYQATRDRLLVIETTAAKIRRLPRVVTIQADQNLRFQDGFYALERTSEGTPFRWTGPAPQFSFDIFIDRTSALQMQLEALSCIDFDVQKNVSLLADGESIPVNVERGESGLEVTATLPPRDGNEGTNLVFVLPAALTPPDSDDTRTLGFAFSRIGIMAVGADVASMTAPHSDAPKSDDAVEADEFGLDKSAAAE
jgi:hypothetical protein